MNSSLHSPARRKRARQLVPGLPGLFAPGPLNAITDGAGVRVGRSPVIEGSSVRTGVAARLPHEDSLYLEPVPAGLSVANGFGKFIGSTQLSELGELETPILLTNTLSAPRAADALIRWVLEQTGHDGIKTVSPRSEERRVGKES